MVLNSSTLALQQCCTIALSLPPSLPPQHPLQRGGEGLITALSRNWSMFNSSGELTGYTHEMAFGCFFLFFLSGLTSTWVVWQPSQTPIISPQILILLLQPNRIDFRRQKANIQKKRCTQWTWFWQIDIPLFLEDKSLPMFIHYCHLQVCYSCIFPMQETHHSSQYSIKSKT